MTEATQPEATQGPKSGAERFRAYQERKRAIKRRKPENPRRRKRLEKNPEKWLMWYLAPAFPAPFSAGHKELIRNTVSAADTRTGSATAQPRGEGKTTVLRGTTMYLVATRKVRFPVLVGWKHPDAGAAFSAWLTMLCDSERFTADYPELCDPFTVSTHATALASLVWDDNGKKTGASVSKIDKLVVLPDGFGAIAARSAQGDAKGLNVTLLDGTVLRPDFILLDDAQDPKQAGNPDAVAKTIDTIENVFLGMAGPQKRLTAAAACTVEAEDDVSMHWLSRPGWASVTVARVEKWPDGSTGGTWESEKDCPLRSMWSEWWEICQNDGQKKANTFFRKKRKAMSGAMVVSWKHRYDKEVNVCAIDAAMYDWHNMGEDVFARGQQNQPLAQGVDVYSITPAQVASKVDEDREPWAIPEGTDHVVVGIDTNPSVGLSWVALALTYDRTAAVVAYGIWTGSTLPTTPTMTTDQEETAIQQAAAELEEMLEEKLAVRPSMLVYDGRGSRQAIIRYCQRLGKKGLPRIRAYGEAARHYRPNARKTVRVGEYWRISKDGRDQWCNFHSDYWLELTQRAFTCAEGVTGAATLPKGRHGGFCRQMCAERLMWKRDTPSGMEWRWAVPNGANDLPDAMKMAYVGASIVGCGKGPEKKAKKKMRIPIGRR